MSTKRRTRKEKQRANLHRTNRASSGISILPISEVEQKLATYSFTDNVVAKKVVTPMYNTHSFTYVLKDARRTLTITLAIAAINIILFLLSKNGIFNPKVFGL